MKNFKLISGLLLLFTLVTAGLCTDIDDDSKNYNESILSRTLLNKTWKINKLIKDGQNKTSDFSNTTYFFSDNNFINAKIITYNYRGTWNIVDLNNDIDQIEDLRLDLDFSNAPNFALLTNNWLLESFSENSITLKKQLINNNFDEIELVKD